MNSFTLAGSNLRFTVDLIGGSYSGIISPDGNVITGKWTQGKPQSLDFRRARKETLWNDPSPHKIQTVHVEKDVDLEVLDWGGVGRPLVLLAGMSNTAHVFDNFASKLVGAYHVYGITRRGFGASSTPEPVTANYTADRLGDDVLAVCNSLHLTRPILVGHSIAGEELSSIGSRHPEKVAGLIYLDAAYVYAYYDQSQGDLMLDLNELQEKIEQLKPGHQAPNPSQLIKDLLGSVLPQFE